MTSEVAVPPGAKEGDKFTDGSDGCVWLVVSRRLGDDNLTTLTIRCIGTNPADHSPRCPHLRKRRVVRC